MSRRNRLIMRTRNSALAYYSDNLLIDSLFELVIDDLRLLRERVRLFFVCAFFACRLSLINKFD